MCLACTVSCQAGAASCIPAVICHYLGKGDATGCQERRNCHEAAVKSGGKALNMCQIAGNKLFQANEQFNHFHSRPSNANLFGHTKAFPAFAEVCEYMAGGKLCTHCST